MLKAMMLYKMPYHIFYTLGVVDMHAVIIIAGFTYCYNRASAFFYMRHDLIFDIIGEAVAVVKNNTVQLIKRNNIKHFMFVLCIIPVVSTDSTDKAEKDHIIIQILCCSGYASAQFLFLFTCYRTQKYSNCFSFIYHNMYHAPLDAFLLSVHYHSILLK